MSNYARAIYHPTQNIEDVDWLKSAVLYWDKIHTIVPKSVDDPYEREEEHACSSEGILEAIRAVDHPDTIRNVSRYFEGLRWDHFGELTEKAHGGRAPRDILLHEEKMSFALADMLRQGGFAPDADGWIRVGQQFSGVYMGALVEELAHKLSASSVTDRGPAYGMMLSKGLGLLQGHEGHDTVAAALVHITFEQLKVRPDAPIGDVLKFRNKRTDELKRFRIAVRDLAKKVEVEDGQEIEPIVHDVYRHEIEPAYADLKASFGETGLGAFGDAAMRLVTLSPGNYLSAAAGTAAGVATAGSIGGIAAGGVFLGGLFVQRWLERRRLRRESPYAYLLSLSKTFGDSGF